MRDRRPPLVLFCALLASFFASVRTLGLGLQLAGMALGWPAFLVADAVDRNGGSELYIAIDVAVYAMLITASMRLSTVQAWRLVAVWFGTVLLGGWYILLELAGAVAVRV
jgi:hypothetical protein